MGTFGSTKKPRSLAEDFRMRSDEQLEDLLYRRIDLLNPAPKDISELAVTATSVTSVNAALDALNKTELVVCEVLAALPDSCHVDAVHSALQTATGYQQTSIEHALTQLWNMGLIWGNSDSIHLVRTARELFGQYPCALGPKFAEHRPSIRKFVDNPSLIHELLSVAPQEVTELLQELSWSNPRGFYPNASKRVTPKSARGPVEWLIAHDVLVVTDENVVVLPQEIALQIRDQQYVATIDCEIPELTQHNQSQFDPNGSGALNALQFIQNVERALNEITKQPVSSLRTGGIPAKVLTALANATQIDVKTLNIIFNISVACSFIEHDEEVGWMTTGTYTQWRSLDDAKRWSKVAETWYYMNFAPHLAIDENEKLNALSFTNQNPDISALRRLVADTLLNLISDTSTNSSLMLDYFTWRQPRVFNADRKRAIIAILDEMELLGISSMGTLTTFGREMLSGNDDIHELQKHLPPEVDYIIVQADLTALAPGRLPINSRLFMQQVANVESTGGATTYRFTAGSVLNGLEQGLSGEQILEGMTRLSKTALPQPLEYLIKDVERRHGQLSAGKATMFLRCEDAELLRTILADRSLEVLGLRQVDTHLLISEQSAEKVFAGLRKAGYAPLVEQQIPAVKNSNEVNGSATKQHITTMKSPVSQTLIPSKRLIASVVQSLRPNATDSSVHSTPVTKSGEKTSVHQTLEIVHQAMNTQSVIWIGYVDKSGVTHEALIEPLHLVSGSLTAFDTNTQQVRTFTIARITSAQFIDGLSQQEGAAS